MLFQTFHFYLDMTSTLSSLLEDISPFYGATDTSGDVCPDWVYDKRDALPNELCRFDLTTEFSLILD